MQLFRHLLSLTRMLLLQPYLKAVRESFCTMMPFIVILSLVHFAGSFCLNPSGPVMGEEGLDIGALLSGGLHGQAWRDSDYFRQLERLSDYLSISLPLLGTIFALALTDRLAKLWRIPKLPAMLCTLSSYFFLIASYPGDVKSLAEYFLGRGFLLALLVATSTAFIYSRLLRISWLRLSLPQEMQPRMARSMSALLPLGLTLAASLVIAWLWTDVDSNASSLPQYLRQALGQEFAQQPAVALAYEAARRLLWWLGLNGYSLTTLWTEAFYVPAQLANEFEGDQYIFTVEFFDSLSVSLLGLAISIWVFSTQLGLRRLASFSMPCLFLSINEPFLFALPIVLNPLFLTPYLLASLVNTYVGYLAISSGIVPIFQYAQPSVLPAVLQGFITTGDPMGGVLQLVWLALDIVIYSPFVIVFNLLEQEELQPGQLAKEGEGNA